MCWDCGQRGHGMVECHKKVERERYQGNSILANQVVIQEESKDQGQPNMISWPDLEEEESKESKNQMMQPQDYVPQKVESGKQAKKIKIAETYEKEVEGTKKTLKRMKQIKLELMEITETYQKNVLERTDELEQLGELEAARSKEFAKMILNLSKIVPPAELEVSINSLETFIQEKLAEMEKKIKKIKSKKKKQNIQKTLTEKMQALETKSKQRMGEALTMCDPKSYVNPSGCCIGTKFIDTGSFWPMLWSDVKSREFVVSLILKFTTNNVKVNAIHYKLSKKTKKLSAFQIQYSHGILTTLMKAKNETEDDMQIVTLSKKQTIAKLSMQRVDKHSREFQFID